MAQKHDDEVFKTIFTYGEQALKSVILINGGASIALLAFIGNILARGVTTANVSDYSLPLAYYVFGVLSGALATGGSYATQYSYFHFGRKAGVFWHWITGTLVGASYALFGVGGYLCYDIIKNTA